VRHRTHLKVPLRPTPVPVSRLHWCSSAHVSCRLASPSGCWKSARSADVRATGAYIPGVLARSLRFPACNRTVNNYIILFIKWCDIKRLYLSVLYEIKNRRDLNHILRYTALMMRRAKYDSAEIPVEFYGCFFFFGRRRYSVNLRLFDQETKNVITIGSPTHAWCVTPRQMSTHQLYIYIYIY